MDEKSRRYKKVIACIIIILTVLLSGIPASVFAADSFSAAETLNLSEPYSDMLESKNDINYYKFTTTNNDSFYKVELRNTEATDTIGLTLYSDDDATTDIYELIAGKANLDSDTRKLEPNHTYYIAVKNPYSYIGNPIGNYKIGVTEIKDDVSDNFNNSKSIHLNKKVAYNLEATNDYDYFKFTTTTNNSYYNIELSNSEATNTIGLVLYSEDDSTTSVLDITANTAALNSKTIKLEKKHTYYLLVSKAYSIDAPTGKYKLKITEIKDDAPDSFDKCIKLPLNKNNTYNLNVNGDVDYFKFKPTKKGAYTITLANKDGNGSISAIIYNEADVTQNIGFISSDKAMKNSNKFKLKANHTYYIAVKNSYDYSYVTGSYSLSIKK